MTTEDVDWAAAVVGKTAPKAAALRDRLGRLACAIDQGMARAGTVKSLEDAIKEATEIANDLALAERSSSVSG